MFIRMASCVGLLYLTFGVAETEAKDRPRDFSYFVQVARSRIAKSHSKFVASTPAIEASSLEDYDYLRKVEASIKASHGFTNELCRDTPYAQISLQHGCAYAVMEEALRVIQSRHSEAEHVAYVTTWLKDLSFDPFSDACMNLNRPEAESVDVMLNKQYRQVWVNLKCSKDRVLVQGEGWHKSNVGNCVYFGFPISLALSTKELIRKQCRYEAIPGATSDTDLGTDKVKVGDDANKGPE